MELFEDKFPVILADPPWPYVTYSEKGKGCSPEAHYSTMSIEAIAQEPVGEYAARDSVLFLWVTKPILPRAFEVITAWGFKYRTIGFTWVKTLPVKDDQTFFGSLPLRFAFGLGHWTRSNPEQCLLATRGKPHRINADVPELLLAPRRAHSQKPDEIYPLIERLVAGPYLELFCSLNPPHRPHWKHLLGKAPYAERAWPSNSFPGAEDAPAT